MFMKKLLLPLLLGTLILCGCAQTYVMKLNNGTQIVTPSKPKLKGATYYYKDATGRQFMVPQSRVQVIEPASMAQEEKQFEPAKPKKSHWYWPF